MPYKKTKIPPITTSTTEANAKTWLNIIRYSESGTVIQLQDDCEYRVTDIIRNPNYLKKYLGPYYRKYLLCYTDIGDKQVLQAVFQTLRIEAVKRKIILPNSLVSAEDLIHYLVDQGYEIGIFLGKSNRIFTDDHDSLSALEQLLETSSQVSVILFTEIDVTAPSYHQLVNAHSLLFDHIQKYPLYQELDCRQFIQYQNSMWDMQLENTIEIELLHQSGGYLWLISHLQRYFRDNPGCTFTDASKDPSLLTKLNVIWQKFTPEEKLLLTNLANNYQIDTKTHEFLHLSEIGIIKIIKGNPSLGIPLLIKIISHEKNLSQIGLKNNRILLDDQDITNQFSKLEFNFFKYLLKHKKKLVSRDEIATAL